MPQIAHKCPEFLGGSSTRISNILEILTASQTVYMLLEGPKGLPIFSRVRLPHTIVHFVLFPKSIFGFTINVILLMFTITDCNCHNLTILITLSIVLHWNTCKIWMDYWLFFTSDWQSKTESVNETRGKDGFPLGVGKGLFFTDGWCVVYIVKGCQSFKNQKNFPFSGLVFKKPLLCHK